MNIINTIIFSSTHTVFQTSIYQYLKINSIIDALHLFVITPSSLVFSKQYRDYYLIQFYFRYIILYVSRVLNTVSSFINIKIAIDRYIYLNKKSVPIPGLTKHGEHNNKIKINILLFFIFAFAYSIPNLIFYEVKLTNVTLSFSNKTKEVYKTEIVDLLKINKYLKIILHVFQVLLTCSNLFVMIIISTLTYRIIHKKYEDFVKESMQLRKNLNTSSNNKTSEGDVEENVTETKDGVAVESQHLSSSHVVTNPKLKRIGEKTSMLVLWVSFFFIANELVAALGAILIITNAKSRYSEFMYSFACMIILITYVTSCTINIFLYKKFNKTFALKFKKILLCRRCLEFFK
jgi:hypothetical protein